MEYQRVKPDNPCPRTALFPVNDEVEALAGRGVDLENLERLAGKVAQRMSRAGRDEDDVVGADEVGLSLDRQRALAVADDVDVVRRRVPMHTPARATGRSRLM